MSVAAETRAAIEEMPNTFTTGQIKNHMRVPRNHKHEDCVSSQLQIQARKGNLKKLPLRKENGRNGNRLAREWEKSGVENKMTDDKESVKVLQECIDLQLKKSQDYQSENSSVLQAMHYRRGVDTIHDIIIGKLQRATSLIESGRDPNFESLEDTYKDMINYASFAVSYMRGKMEGQDPDRDMFNAKRK